MILPKISNLNKHIIGLFSGQERIVTTPKIYISLTGSLSLAVVLNQCVFWSNKSSLKHGWFYKDYVEWFEETHIPERTLRRRFDKLEEAGLIITKVKKVNGINTKHIFTCLDKIYELILNISDETCPDRPYCPDGLNIDHEYSTKVAPTGQSGRLETAKVAGSTIYTEENIQMCVGEAPTTTHTGNSFSIKKQNQDDAERPAFENEQAKEMFQKKFGHTTAVYENVFEKCQTHYQSKKKWVTDELWKGWITLERVTNFELKPKEKNVTESYIGSEEYEENQLRVTAERQGKKVVDAWFGPVGTKKRDRSDTMYADYLEKKSTSPKYKPEIYKKEPPKRMGIPSLKELLSQRVLQ